MAAVVLDPRQKWNYFELAIEPGDSTLEEVDKAREAVARLWEIDYWPKILRQIDQNSGNTMPTSHSEFPDTGCNISNEVQRHRQQWKAMRQRRAPGMFTIGFNFTTKN